MPKGSDAFLAHKSEFRARWFMTRLQTVVVVRVMDHVDADAIQSFATEALSKAHVIGGGLQSGTAVFPTLVAQSVQPDVMKWARRAQIRRFSAFVRPVLIDTSAGESAYYRGTPVYGLMYGPYLRRAADRYFKLTEGNDDQLHERPGLSQT